MIAHSEISKARSLFLSRGILNREVLRDEIVYSWVRSKLHNISIELLNQGHSQKSLDISKLDIKTSNVIKMIRSTNNKNSLIVICDLDGNVIFRNQNNFEELNQINNFSENCVGTCAVGISMNTDEDISVYGYEHYNKLFTNFVSSCIVVEDEKQEKLVYLGIVSPNRFETQHNKILEQLNKWISLEDKHEIIEDSKDEVEVVIESKNIEKSCDSNECKVFTLSVIEKRTIIEALEYYHYNHKKAAIALGIGRSTLYRKIKEYDIED